MRASMCYTNHVKLYNDDDVELNLFLEKFAGKKRKYLPRLLSLFFILVVDGHADDIVGEETGKCG